MVIYTPGLIVNWVGPLAVKTDSETNHHNHISLSIWYSQNILKEAKHAAVTWRQSSKNETKGGHFNQAATESGR